MTNIYSINECDAFYNIDWTGSKETNYKDTIFITKTVPDKNTLKKLLNFTQNPFIYITITGYGGTILEPDIPDWFNTLVQAEELKKTTGFQGLVIRINPIIPTEKGIEKALKVFQTAISKGFDKFSYEMLQLTEETREKFQKNRLPMPPDISKANPLTLLKFKDKIDEWKQNGIRIVSVFDIRDMRIPEEYRKKYKFDENKEKKKTTKPLPPTCGHRCLLCQKI